MVGVSAFVLAGGQSSRMGADKAFLQIDGQPLVRRMVALAQSVAPGARIVGRAEKFHDYAEVVVDVFPDCGPLGGIHAALRASQADLNLVLAVDMPFLAPDFLRYLLEEAKAGSCALVTVPRVEGRWQPLCAIYRSAFADLAEQALRIGKYKIDPLFRQTELRTIDEAEFTKRGFDPAMFRNLNTPEDLQAAFPQAKQPVPARRIYDSERNDGN